MLARLSIITFLLFVSGCSGVDLLNTITPSSDHDLTKNISYFSTDRGKLNVYTPEDPKEDAPVLIFTYGGSWTSGDKDDYKFIGQSFAAEGYSVIIPDYRLYPEVKFPTFIEDIAQAVAWTDRHYPNRSIVLIGHSAGAHTTMMLATAPRFLKNAKVNRCNTIAGAVGLSGPYGIQPLIKQPYISIFPDRFQSNDAPLRDVRAPTPPVFLLSGLKDREVSPDNTRRLTAAIQKRGGIAKAKFYPDFDHIDTAKFLATFFADKTSLKSDILSFIDEQPGKRQAFCR